MPSDPVAAFSTLYAEHHGWLHGVLRRRLGCAHRAEDLTHDTFVKVLATEASAAMREPRAFLGTIAHGLVVSHWRRLDLERAYLAALEAQPMAMMPSPEERSLVIEALQRIDALLSRLSAKAASAFLLAQVDGLTYAEIAEQLGVSDRMVKKYMAQAMNALLLADA